MTTFDLFDGLLALCAVLLAVLACALVYAHVRAPARRITAGPLGRAEASSGAERWIALPGNVIELGASGFRITLNTGPEGWLYALHTPEGHLYSQAHDLRMLKGLGERLAAERDEFACHERTPSFTGRG